MLSQTFLIAILLTSFIAPIFTITCLSNSDSPISYFFLLKYPRKTQQISGEDNKYAYFDASMTSTDFTLRNRFIDDDGEALHSTLNQINQNNGLQVIAWNDEPATGESVSSENTAHSKGVIIYDANQGNGVYIVHSMPKYPSFDSNGNINILIPTGERRYGQNVLCMNLDANNLDKVASGLNIIKTIIYYNSFKDQSLPNLYAFSQKSTQKTMKQTIELTVDGQYPFVGFFKNPGYSGYIFEDIMIPYLNSDLSVESWGRPYQAATCNQHSCVNIKNIQIQDDNLGAWTDEDDHSKWGIVDNGSYVCSGDMNRMTSQAKRGGAFFCFQDEKLWKALNSAIVTKDSCSSNSFLSF